MWRHCVRLCPLCPRGAQPGAAGRRETGWEGPGGLFGVKPEYDGLAPHLLGEGALDAKQQGLGALGVGIGAVA
jgi:hypothetical protein